MSANRHAAILIVCMVFPTGLLLLAMLLGLRGSEAYAYLMISLVVTAVAVLVQLVAAVTALFQGSGAVALTLLVTAGASVLVPLGVVRSQSHYIGMYTFYPL